MLMEVGLTGVTFLNVINCVMVENKVERENVINQNQVEAGNNVMETTLKSDSVIQENVKVSIQCK